MSVGLKKSSKYSFQHLIIASFQVSRTPSLEHRVWAGTFFLFLSSLPVSQKSFEDDRFVVWHNLSHSQILIPELCPALAVGTFVQNPIRQGNLTDVWCVLFGLGIVTTTRLTTLVVQVPQQWRCRIWSSFWTIYFEFLGGMQEDRPAGPAVFCLRNSQKTGHNNQDTLPSPQARVSNPYVHWVVQCSSHRDISKGNFTMIWAQFYLISLELMHTLGLTRGSPGALSITKACVNYHQSQQSNGHLRLLQELHHSSLFPFQNSNINFHGSFNR